jgi:hypothetical protein
MKVVYTGLESQGKTLFLAQKLQELLKRNINWKKKYGFLRPIYTNLKLGVAYSAKYSEYLRYWKSVKEIIEVTGADIIWDEISTDFSALKKEPLPKAINRWLRQGAKQGVSIYATAQEYHDIHNDFRRRVFEAYKIHKIIGSERGGENLPKVGLIWGICYKRSLEINPYNELMPVEYGMPDPLFISRELCEVFDTHQLIKESIEQPTLEHIEQYCPVKGCFYNTNPVISHKGFVGRTLYTSRKKEHNFNLM